MVYNTKCIMSFLCAFCIVNCLKGDIMQKIRFGANYIPSKNWLHNWVDFDAASVEEALYAAKELGIDHIRAHIMWHYFQIDPTKMSSVCIKNLEHFVRICEKVDMDYHLSLFTGFMSGLFFYPAWIKKHSGKFEGVFTNPESIVAEKYFIREIAKIVGDSPNFLGFDLGNELSCIALQDNSIERRGSCDKWNREMLSLCEELVPNKLHTNGVDHMPWFDNIGFSCRELANTGAMTSLHCYSVFTGALERFGRMSTESIHLAPFMQELADAYCESNNRLYCVQEFGTASDVWDDEMVEFVKASIEAMYTQNNLWGITWWCTHNISREFSAFDKIEYELGLLDINNKPTKAGLLFAEIVKKYRENPVAPPVRNSAFVLKENIEGVRGADTRWENGHKYAEYVRQGIYPKIILPEKANDSEYLRSRGIEKILP